MTVSSITVPAGLYVVHGQVTMQNGDPSHVPTASCGIRSRDRSGDGRLITAQSSLVGGRSDVDDQSTVPFGLVGTLSAANASSDVEITLVCNQDTSEAMYAQGSQLVAVRVDNLDRQ